MEKLFNLAQGVQANGLDYYSAPRNYEMGEGLDTVVILFIACVALVSLALYSAYKRKKSSRIN